MNIQEKQNLKRIIKESHGIDVEVLDKNSTFDFKCNACGGCCTNSTIESIVFRAYDLFNLSIALDVEPADVIDLHGNMYLGPTSSLPVVQLKPMALETQESMMNLLMHGKPILVCPFLKNKKCSVHNHKPGACRLYPLGRLVQTSQTALEPEEKIETIYFLQKNTCCGNKGEKHNVDDWLGGASKTEGIFAKDSDLLCYVSNTINLSKILAYVKDNQESILKEKISSFYDSFMYYYYVNYNKTESFEKQFENNINIIKKEADNLAECIKNLVRNKDISKELGDSFLNKK